MERIRYILAALIGIGLIILIAVLIYRGFTGGNETPPPKSINLSSYSDTDAVATLTIQNPIVGNIAARSVKVSVSKSLVQLTVIQGYEGSILDSATFANNQAAYDTFLQALQRQNFTKGDTNPKNANETGYCPQGNRYIYQFSQFGADIIRFWSTSCGQGTYQGDRSVTRWLFLNQVPQRELSRLTSGISLGG